MDVCAHFGNGKWLGFVSLSNYAKGYILMMYSVKGSINEGFTHLPLTSVNFKALVAFTNLHTHIGGLPQWCSR